MGINYYFKRGKIFLHGLFIFKNFKAAYLISKHQHNFKKEIKNKVQWSKGGFLMRENNLLLSEKNFHQIQGDFILLHEVGKHGNINIQNGELIIEIPVDNKLIFYYVNNHDVLSVIREVVIDNAYKFKELNDKQYVVMDVGMNVGVAALYFASLDNVNKIYAYEPLNANCKLAQKNFAKNTELSNKIRLFNYGLDNYDAEVELPFAHEGDLGFSTSDFVLEKTKSRKVINSRTEKIKIRNIENEISLIKKEYTGSRIMLKLDCEGAEYNIMQDLSDKSLLDPVSLTVIEWHYKGPEMLVQLLEKNGFRITHMEDHINNYTGLIKAVKDGQ